jgi:AcrR family transcriptional regulator
MRPSATPRSQSTQADDSALERIPLGDRLATELKAAVNGERGLRRAARTRAALKLAALEILSEDDLSSLTIAAVTGRAGVAVGTFYVHFNGTRDLALEVFSEFAAVDIAPAMPEGGTLPDLYTGMKATFVEIVRTFRRRRKLFRSLFQMKRQDDAANAVWLGLTASWADALSAIARKHDQGPMPQGFNSFVGHATTAFADEIMTRIYIDEIFGPEFPGDPSNDEVVAEWLAFARHRMLFGMDPDPKLLAAPPPPAVR